MALAETAATATVAFAATNVDDIVVLAVLFARRDERFGTRHIVAGQYAGFVALVAASLLAGVGLLALPDAAVGALGLVPIALGLRGLWAAWGSRDGTAGDGDGDVPAQAAMTASGVAAVTVANGADNIAIYAPLFATVGTGGLTLTVAIFLALVAVWCWAGLLIGSRRSVVRAVSWAGAYAIPVVLVALGVFIVAESGLVPALAG